MASFSIVIETRAEKDLRKLPLVARKRIVAAIDSLANNPHPLASRKMVGSDCLRLRVGDYRVIYTIQDRQLFIYVIRIGHRRDVYSNG